MHFTPTHASWMSMVEGWFSIAERQAIHRGTHTSVKDLNAKLRAYIDGWNDRAHPFTWTKTADQILKKANRKKISSAEHRTLQRPGHKTHPATQELARIGAALRTLVDQFRL